MYKVSSSRYTETDIFNLTRRRRQELGSFFGSSGKTTEENTKNGWQKESRRTNSMIYPFDIRWLSFCDPCRYKEIKFTSNKLLFKKNCPSAILCQPSAILLRTHLAIFLPSVLDFQLLLLDREKLMS